MQMLGSDARYIGIIVAGPSGTATYRLRNPTWSFSMSYPPQPPLMFGDLFMLPPTDPGPPVLSFEISGLAIATTPPSEIELRQ